MGLAIVIVLGASAVVLAHEHLLPGPEIPISAALLPVQHTPASVSLTLPTTPPSSSGGSGVSNSATLPPSVSSSVANAVAARVEPAVVDINVTLPANTGGASGTGMILTSSGLVLTNNHVVRGASTISINIVGHSTIYTGRVLGVDPTADVALVQMEGVSHLPTVSIASAPARIGQAVIAIGNALGKGGMPTVTSGAVVLLDQTITATDYSGGSETLTHMIQMSAALAPGDSGGPLVNTNGRVVGMDTAAGGSSGDSEFSTTAFAIPIQRALTIAHEIENGRASTDVLLQPTAIMGILGVAPPNWQPQFGQIDPSVSQGAAVEIVESGTPASNAGLAPGDIITTFQGIAVTSPAQLEQLETGYHPGDTVNVGWVTPSGQNISARLQLMAGPWA